ncbi:MAG: acyl-CoA dehydrogenase, partial [Actinomycetota bacterium]|nr:acyl-CoA dehydrogenase [Actinomycetota bacterium]
MHFGLTRAQDELQASVRELLAEASPPARVRRVMETTHGVDAELWRAMAGHGLLELPTFVEVAVVAEELGAALSCVPFLSTVLATALGAAGAPLPAGVPAAVALVDDAGRWDRPGAAVDATPAGDGWALSGQASFVVDGMTAGVLVVAARTGPDMSLFTVDGDASGLVRSPLATVDRTRRLARLQLRRTPARRVASPPGAAEAVD